MERSRVECGIGSLDLAAFGQVSRRPTPTACNLLQSSSHTAIMRSLPRDGRSCMVLLDVCEAARSLVVALLESSRFEEFISAPWLASPPLARNYHLETVSLVKAHFVSNSRPMYSLVGLRVLHLLDTSTRLLYPTPLLDFELVRQDALLFCFIQPFGAHLDPQIASCCKQTGNLNIAQCISKIDPDTPGSSSSEASVGTGSSGSPTTSTRSGTIRGASASFVPTTTAAVVANAGCSSLLSKLDACEAATPGFSFIIAWTSQASCFCYSSSSFVPSSFDNYYSSCLSYVETADTDLYTSLKVGQGLAISTPCAKYGDVTATTRRTTGSRTASPGTTPTGDSVPTSTAGSSSGGSSGGSSGAAGAAGDTPAASGQGNVIVQSAFAMTKSTQAPQFSYMCQDNRLKSLEKASGLETSEYPKEVRRIAELDSDCFAASPA
ncbi:MAG: hypothetical protein L6R40_004380 [Gallowayella cf. fulva]|nr:MAG: hypothetical protein L6R40_004380 [Xanthomendoza cf. fulva]